MLDQLRALRLHRAILLDAVAMRNNDDSFHSEQASRHSRPLAEVSARGRDDAGELRLGLLEPGGVNQGAAQFERADRSVVLVLDPGFNAEPLVDQRPTVLRSRQHVAIDQRLRVVDLVQRGKRHGFRIIGGRLAGDSVRADKSVILDATDICDNAMMGARCNGFGAGAVSAKCRCSMSRVWPEIAALHRTCTESVKRYREATEASPQKHSAKRALHSVAESLRIVNWL